MIRQHHQLLPPPHVNCSKETPRILSSRVTNTEDLDSVTHQDVHVCMNTFKLS